MLLERKGISPGAVVVAIFLIIAGTVLVFAYVPSQNSSPVGSGVSMIVSNVSSLASQITMFGGGGGGGGYNGATSTASVFTPISSSSLSSMALASSNQAGPRFGLDLAWYIRGGFGSLHGVNSQDGGAVYSYLTHGWKNSGGVSGGFFTAYAYELHSPPLYPPQYQSDANWLIQFIKAANVDNGGNQAKIYIRLVPENNLDSTLLGTLQDFLTRLGPSSQNPSVVGFGIRGAQEGIFEGGGACCTGGNQNNFVPSQVAYGPSGMNSFPSSVSQFDSMWAPFVSLANSYGYPFGISTGLSDIDTALGQANTVSQAQWFVGDTGYGACGASDTTGVCTYDDWYSKVATPSWGGNKETGVVGGEWDQNWFVPNSATYGITQIQVQNMFSGFAAGWKVNPNVNMMFLYGMPYLTGDDSTFQGSHGLSPFLGWFATYSQQYGFFTDVNGSPPPSPLLASGGSVGAGLIPTGIYIHILGDPTIPNPSWSQTNPVHCCGAETYSVDGQLINLQNGQGIQGVTVEIISFDFTTCTWKVIATATTGQGGFFGFPNGGGFSLSPIHLPSPPLPNTQRNQAYFYDEFTGNSQYGPSNGVLEDLPVIP